MAHSIVWIVSGALWSTIDFATYMSYFTSTAYHIFILVATVMEFAKVCWQIVKESDDDREMYSHNDVEYTLFDFKIDGLLLMIMVEISTIISLVRDRKREWYCFGLGNVYRHRLLQISQRQERIVNGRMINSLRNGTIGHRASIGSSHIIHNVSGNRFFYMYGRNEDSLLLIWIINLACIAYLSFFVWDLHNPWKSAPAAICILAFIVLVYRECDLHLAPLMREQTHFWFLLFAIIEIWFVTVYICVKVDNTDKDEMWKEIGSYLIGTYFMHFSVHIICLSFTIFRYDGIYDGNGDYICH